MLTWTIKLLLGTLSDDLEEEAKAIGLDKQESKSMSDMYLQMLADESKQLSEKK